MSEIAKLRGDKIAAIRTKKRPRLTQQGLADLIGVDKNTIWRWESGSNLCDGEALYKVAEALNVHPDEIIGRAIVVEPSPEDVLDLVKKLVDENRFLKSEMQKGVDPKAYDQMQARERAELQARLNELEATAPRNSEERALIDAFRVTSPTRRIAILWLLTQDKFYRGELERIADASALLVKLEQSAEASPAHVPTLKKK